MNWSEQEQSYELIMMKCKMQHNNLYNKMVFLSSFTPIQNFNNMIQYHLNCVEYIIQL